MNSPGRRPWYVSKSMANDNWSLILGCLKEYSSHAQRKYTRSLATGSEASGLARPAVEAPSVWGKFLRNSSSGQHSIAQSTRKHTIFMCFRSDSAYSCRPLSKDRHRSSCHFLWIVVTAMEPLSFRPRRTRYLKKAWSCGIVGGSEKGTISVTLCRRISTEKP